ncbi:MAG: hypothetical protein WAO19_02945 [Candidatus Kryptoniota bacterium]
MVHFFGDRERQITLAAQDVLASLASLLLHGTGDTIIILPEGMVLYHLQPPVIARGASASRSDPFIAWAMTRLIQTSTMTMLTTQLSFPRARGGNLCFLFLLLKLSLSPRTSLGGTPD